jgi:4-hydroxy-3-polyprenylbenzoate decarboxylase
VVIAAAGEKIRELGTELKDLSLPDGFRDPRIVMPGVIAVTAGKYTDKPSGDKDVFYLSSHLSNSGVDLSSFPLLIICDDSDFVSKTLNNFLWVTFTRSNPSHDIHGVDSFIANKHWGCNGSLIIDARIKPHHAPPLIKDPAIEKRVDALGEKGKSLYGII